MIDKKMMSKCSWKYQLEIGDHELFLSGRYLELKSRNQEGKGNVLLNRMKGKRQVFVVDTDRNRRLPISNMMARTVGSEMRQRPAATR